MSFTEVVLVAAILEFILLIAFSYWLDSACEQKKDAHDKYLNLKKEIQCLKQEKEWLEKT